MTKPLEERFSPVVELAIQSALAQQRKEFREDIEKLLAVSWTTAGHQIVCVKDILNLPQLKENE